MRRYSANLTKFVSDWQILARFGRIRRDLPIFYTIRNDLATCGHPTWNPNAPLGPVARIGGKEFAESQIRFGIYATVFERAHVLSYILEPQISRALFGYIPRFGETRASFGLTPQTNGAKLRWNLGERAKEITSGMSRDLLGLLKYTCYFRRSPKYPHGVLFHNVQFSWFRKPKCIYLLLKLGNKTDKTR